MNTTKTNSAATTAKDKRYLATIAILSVAIPIVVAVLFFMPKAESNAIDVTFLPGFHAILNSLTAVALVIGYYSIKRNQNARAHRAAMLVAFGLSSIFLVSYVTYHYFGESTSYGGDGALKYFYYFILLTHIVLAAVIVPLVLLSVYFGITNQLAKHRSISRWTFPMWLYVAVTGVLVYILIAPYYAWNQ